MIPSSKCLMMTVKVAEKARRTIYELSVYFVTDPFNKIVFILFSTTLRCTKENVRLLTLFPSLYSSLISFSLSGCLACTCADGKRKAFIPRFLFLLNSFATSGEKHATRGEAIFFIGRYSMLK